MIQKKLTFQVFLWFLATADIDNSAPARGHERSPVVDATIKCQQRVDKTDDDIKHLCIDAMQISEVASQWNSMSLVTSDWCICTTVRLCTPGIRGTCATSKKSVVTWRFWHCCIIIFSCLVRLGGSSGSWAWQLTVNSHKTRYDKDRVFIEMQPTMIEITRWNKTRSYDKSWRKQLL